MERFKSMIKGDKTIWFFVFLLAGVGILEVYSCTSMIAYKFQGGDTLSAEAYRLYFYGIHNDVLI